mgnify:CR=1 FL=1
MSKYFKVKLVIFGESEISGKDIFSVKTLFKNRFGLISQTIPKTIKDEFKETDVLLIHGFYLFSTLVSIYHSSTARIFIMPHGSLEIYQQLESRFRKKIFDSIFKRITLNRDLTFLLGSGSEVVGVT